MLLLVCVFRELLKNHIYLVKLEKIRIPQTLEGFTECNKEGLVRSIWMNHSHDTEVSVIIDKEGLVRSHDTEVSVIIDKEGLVRSIWMNHSHDTEVSVILDKEGLVRSIWMNHSHDTEVSVIIDKEGLVRSIWMNHSHDTEVCVTSSWLRGCFSVKSKLIWFAVFNIYWYNMIAKPILLPSYYLVYNFGEKSFF